MNEDIKIILSQCEKADKVKIGILKELLNLNNNDLCETIIEIENNICDIEYIKKKKENMNQNWDKLLLNSNFDSKIIRQLLDKRDREILNSMSKGK